MKKPVHAFLCLFLFRSLASADPHIICKAPKLSSVELEKDSALTKVFESNERKHNGDSLGRRRLCDGCIVIETYFHVVMESHGNKGNLADSNVQDAIAYLNTVYTGTPFRFHLSGTTRTSDDVIFDPLSSGVDDATNQSILGQMLRVGDRMTLNIYSMKMLPRTLGHATFPSGYNGAKDGVFIDFCVVPNSGCVMYVNPQIIAHEVGHWLGLFHIFQGGCNEAHGDFVSDTPAMESAAYTCFFPRNSCPDAPGEDPLDNMMGYALSCMESFTPGQIQRMYDEWMIYREGTGACKAGDGVLSVELKLDSNPEENGWMLFHANGQMVSGAQFGKAEEDQTQTLQICVPYNAPMYYVLEDGGGNGLQASGNYKVWFDGKLIRDNIIFGNRGAVAFTMVEDSGCPEGRGLVQITLLLDAFPDENSWRIQDTSGQVVYSEDQFEFDGSPAYFKHASVWRELCLPFGSYSFTFSDTFGDGLGRVGNRPSPFFRILANNQVLVEDHDIQGIGRTVDFLVQDYVMPSPTQNPSEGPASDPSSSTTKQPTLGPTFGPTEISMSPMARPTSMLSGAPSGALTEGPTMAPSEIPSYRPTFTPSKSPTGGPTQGPTQSPTPGPTTNPTTAPSFRPTDMPSAEPTNHPSLAPSKSPTGKPTQKPSMIPTALPTPDPTAEPSEHPTGRPTMAPSKQPTLAPSMRPSLAPSMSPTGKPSTIPTTLLTPDPTAEPSERPSGRPTMAPSKQPTLAPSMRPTREPTKGPSKSPTPAPTPNSAAPTRTPSKSPALSPRVDTAPNKTKEDGDTIVGFLPLLSSSPTSGPTGMPSSPPSMDPTRHPTLVPSEHPSVRSTSMRPTLAPSSAPTEMPTEHPSPRPSGSPTQAPTPSPTGTPTMHPTLAPSDGPTGKPTEHPSPRPSERHTQAPTSSPSKAPSKHPTDSPTGTLTMHPTLAPSDGPIGKPTEHPSSRPSERPTQAPTSISPTRAPSKSPTDSPTKAPTFVSSCVSTESIKSLCTTGCARASNGAVVDFGGGKTLKCCKGSGGECEKQQALGGADVLCCMSKQSCEQSNIRMTSGGVACLAEQACKQVSFSTTSSPSSSSSTLVRCEGKQACEKTNWRNAGRVDLCCRGEQVCKGMEGAKGGSRVECDGPDACKD